MSFAITEHKRWACMPPLSYYAVFIMLAANAENNAERKLHLQLHLKSSVKRSFALFLCNIDLTSCGASELSH